MADDTNDGGGAGGNRLDPAADPATPGQFSIKKIYLKDLSFESPGSPEVFTSTWEPDLDLHLHTEATPLGSDDYEVAVRATVTIRVGDKPAYLAEAQLAGIFGIIGVTSDELGSLLGSYCPTILFPYLRETVSDLSVRGGYPQLVLTPVNFDALYERHLVDRQGEGAGGEDAGRGPTI